MLDFCFLYDLLYDKIENKLDFCFLHQFSKQLEAAVTRQVGEVFVAIVCNGIQVKKTTPILSVLFVHYTFVKTHSKQLQYIKQKSNARAANLQL